jgi:hypothetical protein
VNLFSKLGMTSSRVETHRHFSNTTEKTFISYGDQKNHRYSNVHEVFEVQKVSRAMLCLAWQAAS